MKRLALFVVAGVAFGLMAACDNHEKKPDVVVVQPSVEKAAPMEHTAPAEHPAGE